MPSRQLNDGDHCQPVLVETDGPPEPVMPMPPFPRFPEQVSFPSRPKFGARTAVPHQPSTDDPHRG